MITLIVLLTFALALICAALASQLNRGWVDWAITAVSIVLIILFARMLVPKSEDPRKRPRVARAVFGVVMMLLVFAGVGVGAAEFWERYQDTDCFSVLDKWAMYGDALLRFTKSGEHPPDAVVMKVAHNQINDYYSQLRDGMCWTMDDLELADQGLRRSWGPRALWSNAQRLFVLQKPEWPATVAMTESERRTRKTELESKYELYLKYLHLIDSARADTAKVLGAN